MMKILFVYSLNDAVNPEVPLTSPAQMQFGISYISSFLKQHGYQTRLLILSRHFGGKNIEKIHDTIQDYRPNIIGFSAVATEYAFIASLAQYIKNAWPYIFLIIGGPHASLNPEKVMADSFDAACIGEGEIPMLELVRTLEKNEQPAGISNLWLKSTAGIERNQTRPFVSELDTFPFPDRALWQEWIREAPGALYSILLGRGCPYRCTYCSNHALRKLATGPYVRFRSPDNVIREIEEIARDHPNAETIYLEVETIGANINFADELCNKLAEFNAARSVPLSFGVNLRIVQKADFEELFKMFKRGGIHFVNIGLESGSEKVRRDVLHRNYTNDDVIKVVRQARKIDIKVCFYNMIGLPDETLSDFNETVDVNRKCQPDWHFTSIFYPYPGTDLYSLCKEKRLLHDGGATDSERTKAVLDMPGFSRRQIQKSYIWFDYYVYRGFKPLYLILSKVFLSYLRTSSFGQRLIRQANRLIILQKMRNRLRGQFRARKIQSSNE